MNKVNPNDVAKWFCNQNIIEDLNSEEGNTKLQKLLFFSQLIYMAKRNGEIMFDEKFNAYKLITNDEIIETLKITGDIFGDASAQELSELSQEFDIWNKYLRKSTSALGKYIKVLSIIPYDEIKKELYKIKKVLYAYEEISKFNYDGVEDY